MARSPALQSMLDQMKEGYGITDDFETASNHPYTCRCRGCLMWWVDMGPDEDAMGNPSYGPFTEQEIMEAKLKRES